MYFLLHFQATNGFTIYQQSLALLVVASTLLHLLVCCRYGSSLTPSSLDGPCWQASTRYLGRGDKRFIESIRNQDNCKRKRWKSKV